MDLTVVLLGIVFLIGLVIAYIIGNKIGTIRRDYHWKNELPLYRKDAVSRSRSVLSGQFSEQLAPFFPDFSFKPNECKFLGSPVDFIVFKGADEKNIDEVVFVEVKGGKSQLNKTEKSLKETIQKKKVSWQEYRISKDLFANRKEFKEE